MDVRIGVTYTPKEIDVELGDGADPEGEGRPDQAAQQPERLQHLGRNLFGGFRYLAGVSERGATVFDRCLEFDRGQEL